uniref:Uncharacterized protein n=1 Tax=Panagrolaimus sp. PS1159 TaxID=55785 RepID=A0AC35FYQ8_9BILA
MTTTTFSREMETDKELNHWLSLAVGGNLPDEDGHGSPLSNFGEPGNDHVDLFSTETTGISLDPIMFTPPDSPTHNESKEDKRSIEPLNLASKSGTSKSNVTSFSNNKSLIFMPKPKSDSANNKVPIYKQKKSVFSSASITLEKALNKVVKSKKADEYSFTDDEEEEPLSKSVGFDFFSDDSRTATGDNDIEPKSQEPAEVTVSKKKSVAESKVLSQMEETKEEIKPEKNNIAEIIRKRKENLKKLSHVFLYSESLEGDDVITPNANFSSDIHEAQNEKVNISDSAQSPEALESANEDEENDSPPILTAPYCEPSSSNGIPILRIKTEIPDLINSPSQKVIDDEIIVKSESREPERTLPKLVIKLRRESVTSPLPKKRKKKHKKKKDDTD